MWRPPICSSSWAASSITTWARSSRRRPAIRWPSGLSFLLARSLFSSSLWSRRANAGGAGPVSTSTGACHFPKQPNYEYRRLDLYVGLARPCFGHDNLGLRAASLRAAGQRVIPIEFILFGLTLLG